MSRFTLKHLMVAGSFVAALSLSTPAMAACAWWDWGCVDTPVEETYTEDTTSYSNDDDCEWYGDCAETQDTAANSSTDDCEWYGDCAETQDTAANSSTDDDCEWYGDCAETQDTASNNTSAASNTSDCAWYNIFCNDNSSNGNQDYVDAGDDLEDLFTRYDEYKARSDTNPDPYTWTDGEWDGIFGVQQQGRHENSEGLYTPLNLKSSVGSRYLTTSGNDNAIERVLLLPLEAAQSLLQGLEDIGELEPENISRIIEAVASCITTEACWIPALREIKEETGQTPGHKTNTSNNGTKEYTISAEAAKKFGEKAKREANRHWFYSEDLAYDAGLYVGAVYEFSNDIQSMAFLLKNAVILRAGRRRGFTGFVTNTIIRRTQFYQDAEDFFGQMGQAAISVLQNWRDIDDRFKGWFETQGILAQEANDNCNQYLRGQIHGKVGYRIITTAWFGAGTGLNMVRSFSRLATRAKAFRSRKGSNGCSARSCGGDACFVAGTAIWTQNGTKAIENIKVGDNVLSRDVENNQTVFKPVTRVFVRSSNVLHLTLARDGRSETIGRTPEHPFYVVGKGFVAAGDLQEGMVIRQVSSDVNNQLRSEVSMNALLTVQKLDYGNTPTQVYNFEVADTHTYVVGTSQALVHNNCDGFKPAPRSHIDFEDVKIINETDRFKSFQLNSVEKTRRGDPSHTIEGSFNKTTGEMTIDFMRTAQPGRGIGPDMITRVIETMGTKNMRSIKGTLSIDNLKVYNQAINNGLSPAKAILETPAAKIRMKLGFEKISFTENWGQITITGALK